MSKTCASALYESFSTSCFTRTTELDHIEASSKANKSLSVSGTSELLVGDTFFERHQLMSATKVGECEQRVNPFLLVFLCTCEAAGSSLHAGREFF